MSIFIQEVLGLLKRNQKKITLDKGRDWFEFGKLYQTGILNTGASYNPKMEPFVIKWGDLVCQATEDLTRTLPGQGNLGFVPVYTDPSGYCNWDTLKDSIITQNTLNTIITIGGNLVVTGDVAINGCDLTSTCTTFNLLNQSTNINFGLNSQVILIGSNTATSVVTIFGTKESTSCSTGSFVVNGGVGIAKSLFVCGNLTVSGDSNLNGNVYLGNALVDQIEINGTLLDNNGTASLINQALVGTGTGAVNWQQVALVGQVCAVNSIPLWTPNASTLGCSLIYQNGNSSTPATKIFIKGGLASEGSQVRTIYDVAIGYGNYAGGESSAAFGFRSLALGGDSFACGHKGFAGGHGSLAAGYNTGAGNYGFGLFTATVTSATLTIDILSGTIAVGNFIVPNIDTDPSIRYEILTLTGTGTIGVNTITIATPISVDINEAVAIEEAVPNRGDSQGAISLGFYAASKGNGAVAIGTRAATDIANQIAIGSSSTTVKLDGTVNDNVPNKLLVIDSSNVVRWRDASTITATITANNGLTVNTGSNVQLGGTLIQTTDIATAGNIFRISNVAGATTSALTINSSSTNSSGHGLNVYSANAFAGYFSTIIGLGAIFAESGGTTPAVTFVQSNGFSVAKFTRSGNNNTGIGVILDLYNICNAGPAVVGLGASINFNIEDSLSAPSFAGALAYEWSAVGPNSSKFSLSTVSGGTTTTKLAVDAQGKLQLNKYGINTFTGTPAYYLAVTSAGDVIETAGGSGGATNLSTSQTASNFTINSDTGTDAIVPLGNGTLAGATLNNYTTAEQTKLAGIAAGAEVNVNADWNATSGDAQILNKPTIGVGTVTSVSGTGTVSGLTLTGTVTSSGNLTLGGALTLTSGDITSGLGFTPYNATNPAGYTSFSEPGIFSGGGTPSLAAGVTGAEIRTLIGAGEPIVDADFVKNTADIYPTSAKITQIITLSQAEYNAIVSPLTSTLYIIL